MNNLLILLAGLVGLISTIIKIAIDNKVSNDYEKDMEDFSKSLAGNDPDGITYLFEQLRRKALSGDNIGQNGKAPEKR